MEHKIIKILKQDKPYEILLDLFNSGELETLLPVLYNLYKTEIGHKNNFYHTLKVLKNVCDNNGSFKMKLVAIFHDIGKPKTKKMVDGKGWTFHNHELVSANMSLYTMDELGIIDKTLRNYVYKMIQYHGRVKIQRDVSESAIRRLDTNVGKDIIFDLICFCKCDITTVNDTKRTRIVSGLETIEKRINEVRAKDINEKWRSPITGYVLMDMIPGIDGPTMGKIKAYTDPKIKSGEWTVEETKDYILKNYSKK